MGNPACQTVRIVVSRFHFVVKPATPSIIRESRSFDVATLHKNSLSRGARTFNRLFPFRQRQVSRNERRQQTIPVAFSLIYS